MGNKKVTLPIRIINTLSFGEPVTRLWFLFVGYGAIAFGLLSIPSEGLAILLIVLFILAGILCLYGCLISYKRDKTLINAKLFVSYGVILMIIASWTRGILLWGVSQHGVGSNFLASAVWLWITIECVFLLISVWKRGIR